MDGFIMLIGKIRFKFEINTTAVITEKFTSLVERLSIENFQMLDVFRTSTFTKTCCHERKSQNISTIFFRI